MHTLIISDDSHRTVMAEAVAEHLGSIQIISVAEIEREGFQSFTHLQKPDVILSCGAIAAPHAVAFKHLLQGAVPTVSILDPGPDLDFFDLVIAPNHEPLPRYDDIFLTTGYINKVNPDRLNRAKADFLTGKYPFLEGLKLQSPVIALLVGGVHVGDDVKEEDIIAIVETLKAQGGTVLATTSPRTPLKISQALIDYLPQPNFIYDFKRRAINPNPYAIMLSLAEHVVVTGDSARMVSEAVSSGKPTWIYAPEGRFFQYQQLHHSFYAAEKAGPLSAFDPKRTFDLGLNEAARAAEYIRKHLLENLPRPRELQSV
jgi:mitochondrial fission protein ELM1